jgi:hypothetical protein
VSLVKSCPNGEFPLGAKVAALMNGLGHAINGTLLHTKLRQLCADRQQQRSGDSQHRITLHGLRVLSNLPIERPNIRCIGFRTKAAGARRYLAELGSRGADCSAPGPNSISWLTGLRRPYRRHAVRKELLSSHPVSTSRSTPPKAPHPSSGTERCQPLQEIHRQTRPNHPA